MEGGGVAGLDGCFGGVEAGGEGEVAGTAGRGPAGEGEGLGREVGVRGERDGDSVLAGLTAGEGEERAGGEAEGSFHREGRYGCGWGNVPRLWNLPGAIALLFLMRVPVLCLAASFLMCVPLASAQLTTLPLWPNGSPEPTKVVGPEMDPTTDANRMVSGKPVVRVTNVSKPTLAVYPPRTGNTGAAALVFPGGGYVRLAIQVEGTEVCDWLNSIGMTCVLVKYRVPEEMHYPESTEDLEDAQQAMRMTRAHAAEWHIDPARIGAIGFSAGAHLAAVLSTHPDFQGKGVAPSTIDARPNFQMVIYPGYTAGKDGKVVASLTPDAKVPPTFLLQAENDYTANVESSIAYFRSLKEAKVPVELHVFTQGGHGFGLRPTELPISRWPVLAEGWLHTIHVLGPKGEVGRP